MFPFFSNFSETPCMKVGFDGRTSLIWWMRAIFPQVGDSIFFCLPLLAGNSLLVIQKAKLLNINSKLWLPPQVKVWGDSEKITVIFRNLIHTKLLQITKESLNEQWPSTQNLYACVMYLCIHCFNWISRLEYLKIFEWFHFSLKYKGCVKFSK